MRRGASVIRYATTPQAVRFHATGGAVSLQTGFTRRPIATLADPGEGNPNERESPTIALAFLTPGGEFDSPIAPDARRAELLVGVLQECSRRGVGLLVIEPGNEDEAGLGAGMPQEATLHGVCGAVVVGASSGLQAESVAGHVPHVAIGYQCAPGRSTELVCSDDVEAGLIATRYLLELGHRRIGFIMDRADVAQYERRLSGYRCALFGAAVAPSREFVIGPDSAGEVRARLRNAVEGAGRPTAFVACSDKVALNAIAIWEGLDIRVPRDVSLIGFDDHGMSRHANPTVTAVHEDRELMGRLAVQAVCARLRQWPGRDLAVWHRVSVCVQVRESCRSVS